MLTDAGVFFIFTARNNQLMKKGFAFLLFQFIFSTLIFGVELSEEAEISLLTCTPGGHNASAYGHSALRVYDPLNRIDSVYNYGTYDPDIENFSMKFARGTVQYSLEVSTYGQFLAVYNYYKRSVIEQNLTLTQAQKQSIFDFLTENSKGDNKYYWYDFIFNNCSSIIRDIIEDQTDVEFSRERSKFTFRQLIDKYNKQAEWNDLGIDVCLGMNIDRKAKMFETMFLPDYLMTEFDNATVNGSPLVSNKRTVIEHGYNYFNEGKRLNQFKPGLVLWIIFGLFFMSKLYIKRGLPPVFSIAWLSILGISGWFLLFLWLGTRHDAARLNLNILWAIPFYFPLAFLLLKKQKPRWLLQFFFVCRVILISTLCIWPLFFPQEYHIAILPIILITLLSISSNIPVSMKN